MNGEIQSYRESLLNFVNESQKIVLVAAQSSYGNIRYANAALTSHLDSAYAVVEELDLSGLHEDLAKRSSDISSFLEEQRTVLEDIDTGMYEFSKISSSIEKMLKPKN